VLGSAHWPSATRSRAHKAKRRDTRAE
jgi:hypothetical protein